MIRVLGKEHILGSFCVDSGAMKIGDPCYKPDTWCLGHKDDVLDGSWKAKMFRADDSITDWGDRNTALFAFNENYFEDNFGFDDIEVQRFLDGAYKTQFLLDYTVDDNIGVDSGQAGIYDANYFIAMKAKDKEIKENRSYKDTWYWNDNCEITLNRLGAGIIKNKKGCVTSSGYGDGMYEAYCFFNKDGYIVAVFIPFIFE